METNLPKQQWIKKALSSKIIKGSIKKLELSQLKEASIRPLKAHLPKLTRLTQK
jgi:hypothetical protein